MNKSKRNKRWVEYVLYYWLYSWIFVFCFCFVLAIFDQNGARFVWELDGGPMLYPAFEYVGRSLREFFKSIFNGKLELKQYDFSLGLGKNIVQFAGNWYFEPLSLLCMFVSEKHVFFLYQVLVVLRFYLCGISFSLFCFYKRQNYFTTLIGSLSYVFCFYTLYWGVRFPLFLAPMIYLPLMLIGIDKQLKEKKSTFFIGMIFLSAWTHYYYLIINTFFLGIYFVVEYMTTIKKYLSVKNFISNFVMQGVGIAKSYILGCSMAAVLLLPNIYVFLHANRGGGNLNIQNIWYYGKDYYQKLWSYIGAPIPGFSIGYEAVLGLLPLTVVGLLIMLTTKKEHLKVYSGIGFVCLVLPVCTYILCGFSNINNRWIYGLVFGASYGLCKGISRLQGLSFKQRSIIFIYILVYGVTIFTVCKNVESELAFVYMALYLATVFVVFIIPKLKLYISQVVIMVLLCVQIIIWEYYLFSPKQLNYVSQFMDKENIRETICDSSARYIDPEIDNTFYRTDVIEAQRSSLSAAALEKYYGISEYSNVMGNDLYQYWLSVENAGLQERIMNYDLDGRTYLIAQTAVKYIACEENMKSYLPYGFSYLQSAVNQKGVPLHIYYNEFALPLGYTYDTYAIETEYEKSLPMERQEILLNTLILDEDVVGVEKVTVSDIKKNIYKLDYTILDMKNIEKIDDFYIVQNGGGSIVLGYCGVDCSETYLRLDNLNISENTFLDWTWLIDNGSGNCKSLFSMSDYNYYRPDTHNYTISLGYADNPIGKCVIYIPCEGTFTMDEIEIWAQKFDNYAYEIEERRKDVWENFTINNNVVAGNISVDKNKLLFFSIPYDSGWNATIDDKRTKIMRANYGYMALQLPQGEHYVKLQYTIPGMELGIIISVTGWLLYLSRFIKLPRKE